jgi:hypothetical protein
MAGSYEVVNTLGGTHAVFEFDEVHRRRQMLAQATFFNPLEPDRQLSKKMQGMKCSNFRGYGATALLGLPLPLEYVGANVMADSHSRRYVRHTSAQATYRHCLPWAAAVRRESSVASNERVRDSILLRKH